MECCRAERRSSSTRRLTDYDFGAAPPDGADPGRPDDAAGPRARRHRADGCGWSPAPMATLDQIATVHDAGADRGGPAGRPHRRRPSCRSGSAPTTTRSSSGMHEAAAHVVGRQPRGVPARCGRRESLHAANITGGLHHAMPDRASGFCVYNDVAVGIRWLLDQGAERVAYVDVDVHHGDGVEAIFWDDPRVLTISLHETGQFLFPGTGFADDIGGEGAEGSAVNVALPPGTADAGWLRAFHAVVPDAGARVRARRPGHPARLRLPRRGPARAPDAERRRPAGGVPRPARPGPRGRRRALGGHRRRRLRAGRRGAARLDPPAGVVAGTPLDPATPTPGGVARPRARADRRRGARAG